MNYPAASCILIVLVALVMAVDFASSRLRARLVWAAGVCRHRAPRAPRRPSPQRSPPSFTLDPFFGTATVTTPPGTQVEVM